MAARESVRPLPPLNPPPKGSGTYSAVQGLRSEPPPEGEAINTEGLTPGAFAPQIAIDSQIADLERWALANVRSDRRQTLRFWALKGVAFVGAVVAAVLASLGHHQVVVVFASISALCVAIDAAWPSSSFRNAHARAVQDLRELENALKLKWDKVRLANPDPKAPARIAHALALLDEVQAKREEIGKYLGAAEASPDVQRS
jgi:hypothetical protein